MNWSRYADILAQHGMAPFQREPWINPETGEPDQRVIGERIPMRWRVSRDEWARLVAMVEGAWGWEGVNHYSGNQLAGWPIGPDDTLSPNSVIFERDAARRIGEALEMVDKFLR